MGGHGAAGESARTGRRAAWLDEVSTGEMGKWARGGRAWAKSSRLRRSGEEDLRCV